MSGPAAVAAPVACRLGDCGTTERGQFVVPRVTLRELGVGFNVERVE